MDVAGRTSGVLGHVVGTGWYGVKPARFSSSVSSGISGEIAGAAVVRAQSESKVSLSDLESILGAYEARVMRKKERFLPRGSRCPAEETVVDREACEVSYTFRTYLPSKAQPQSRIRRGDVQQASAAVCMSLAGIL